MTRGETIAPRTCSKGARGRADQPPATGPLLTDTDTAEVLRDDFASRGRSFAHRLAQHRPQLGGGAQQPDIAPGAARRLAAPLPPSSRRPVQKLVVRQSRADRKKNLD